jgi:hypothetical protein
MVLVVVVSLIAVSLTSPPMGVAGADPRERPLESRRLRSEAVYVGTVTAVRRLGALEGLTGETQGRMEAGIRIAKVLRARSGAAPAEEVPVRFDSRAPAAEGEGFHALVPGEAVLVFADGFEAAYPRELLHGPPAALATDVKALRDFVAAMDADTMRLHGLSAATRASQVRLYDEVLAALSRLSAPR